MTSFARTRSTFTGCGIAVALAQTSCGHTSGSALPSDSGAEVDGAPALDAAAARDAGSAGGPDASPPDAASSAGDAGGSSADGGVPGVGIGQLRARLCTEANYPTPLAGGSGSASPLGAGGYGFVEGAVWVDEQQRLFFSDMNFAATGAEGPPSQVRSLTLDGRAGVLVGSSGSNGLALGPAGSLLAATHDTQSLSLYALADGARTRLDVRAGAKRLNSPNDLVLRSDGSVYFTDPDYQLGNGRSSETGVTAAYRVRALGQGALVAEPFESSLEQPNGIALSPDERTLYLGSSGPELYAYALGEDGSVGERRVLARPGASDGLTVDCAGNLYVTTGQSVRIYGPSGAELGSIAVAETTSNVAFGGADHRTLFITAQTGVYSIALAVPGFPY